MVSFDAQDPDFEASVRRSFEGLTLMRTVGARLLRVAPGDVEIDLPFRDDLTQHHGFLAAAVLTAIVDVACGYAAMTLMPPGASVLTVEYKVNFLSPAQGERVAARGRVIRAGRAVTVCAGDVLAVVGGNEKLVATMIQAGSEAKLPSHHREVSIHLNEPPSHHRRRTIRSWCVCRGRGLRHRLRELAGIE